LRHQIRFDDAAASSALLVASGAVVSGCKHGKNFHEVADELFPRGGSSACQRDQYCPELLEQPLKELESEARKAVAMGNHNALDTSLEELSQYGLKPAPLVVEAGGDVGDDAVGGASSTQEGHLSLQVASLLGG
jgi:hypothetical protein